MSPKKAATPVQTGPEQSPFTLLGKSAADDVTTVFVRADPGTQIRRTRAIAFAQGEVANRDGVRPSHVIHEDVEADGGYTIQITVPTRSKP